jgi:hypothetical protein
VQVVKTVSGDESEWRHMMGNLLTLGFLGFVAYGMVLASGFGNMDTAMQVLHRGAYILFMWTS